jgi:hypothetical protein
VANRKRTSIVWALSHDEFQRLLDKSHSISELLRSLNLNDRSGNHRTVLRRLEEEIFNLNKFRENRRLDDALRGKRVGALRAIPLASILVQNSTYPTSKLKHRLLQERVLENRCNICGLFPTWNEKPLSLQLDHINGVSNDNRLENLQIVCPNCHSQTETYAGKRLRKAKVYETLRHRRQRYIAQRKVAVRPSKRILTATVKKLGYCETGRLYGVTDNAIRKWLR